MDFNTLKKYCLGKKGAYEDFPFDSSTLVFKVGSKMFALTDIDCKSPSLDEARIKSLQLLHIYIIENIGYKSLLLLERKGGQYEG